MYIITRNNQTVMQSAAPLLVTAVEAIPARTDLDGEPETAPAQLARSVEGQ